MSSQQSAVRQAARLPQGLTRAEDDELRRLHWLSEIGALAAKKVERLIELRLRDRRHEIRPPREFADGNVDAVYLALRRWFNARHPQLQTLPDAEPSETVAAEPVRDLQEVQRQLDRLVKARLLAPLREEDQSRYEQLLEAERSLLASNGP